MFWHKKNCPHRLHKEVFTHRNFYTQKFYPEQFLHTDFFPHTQAFTHRIFMHSSFYTDVFTHRPLHIFFFTQKFVHRARFYTTSSYRDRFVSPSWSPTFRVPPLKFNPNFCWLNWLVRFDEIPIVVDFVHFSCSNPHVSWWNPHCSQWMMSPMTAVLGP
jgi:hypothetical protein